MTATEIDYEAEYNNRARVPKHPQIFERWRAAAKAFRDEMTAQNRAELAVAYGTPPRQIIDLFLAEPDSGKLAMFVHGGYWRSLEPATFSHSAGGHLAACALATDWKELGMPRDAVPAACAISGVFDLTPLIGISMNQDLRLDLLEARRVSPLFWDAPRGRVLDVIVGAQESREFLRQSREIADAWAKAGTTTRCEEAPGNHFTVLDPLADPGSATVKRLAALAEQTPH